MLELRGVFVKSGKFELKNINISIKKGETHAILGPSGAGKTTLLETVAGFKKPLFGEILFKGEDISSLEVYKRDIGYLPQNALLFPHLNVYENILYSLKVKRKDIKKERDYLDTLIKETKIEHILDRDILKLSGGEKQRVALVRALASKPKILLLDEPFSALNETLREDLWKLLKRLQKQFGFTVLIITHLLKEAFALGDSVSVIIDGEILQTGDKEEVWERPKGVKVASYFGIKNIFKAKIIQKNGKTFLKSDIFGEFEKENLDKKKGEVLFGIRSEYIKILEKHKKFENCFILDGEIKDIISFGREFLISFLPKNFKKEIEIRSDTFPHSKNVKISVPKDKIFIL